MMWLVGVAAAMGSAAFAAETTTRAAPPESAGQLRSKADEALIGGKTDEALSLLGKAISLEPLNERNLYKRARVYLRAKRHHDAIGDLTAAEYLLGCCATGCCFELHRFPADAAMQGFGSHEMSI